VVSRKDAKGGDQCFIMAVLCEKQSECLRLS